MNDLVPDWIVGFYLGRHIVPIVIINEQGVYKEVDGLIGETDAQAHRLVFRQALGEFERSFKYRPSTTQVRDAVAQIAGLRALNAQLSGDVDPFDDSTPMV